MQVSVHLFRLIAFYSVLYFFGTITLATENNPKVVSLNVCTDQFVMLLADDSQIISLSEISTDILSSAMAEEASKYHQNNSGAEEVYLLQPDIVFAGIYTAKATVNMLESLGIRVEKFEPASTIEQIVRNMQRTGKLLGHTERANTLVANFEARLTDLTTGINASHTCSKDLSARDPINQNTISEVAYGFGDRLRASDVNAPAKALTAIPARISVKELPRGPANNRRSNTAKVAKENAAIGRPIQT